MKIKPRLKEELRKYILNKLRNESKNATLISSHKLTKDQIDEIKVKFPRLKNKKINLQTDEELLAGFIIKEGSKVTDLSLKAKLIQFKKTINEIT
ncbi:MAG: F0F1 ATP synthase subunit delta [Patescibacteria group bacterium]